MLLRTEWWSAIPPPRRLKKTLILGHKTRRESGVFLFCLWVLLQTPPPPPRSPTQGQRSEFNSCLKRYSSALKYSLTTWLLGFFSLLSLSGRIFFFFPSSHMEDITQRMRHISFFANFKRHHAAFNITAGPVFQKTCHRAFDSYLFSSQPFVFFPRTITCVLKQPLSWSQ